MSAWAPGMFLRVIIKDTSKPNAHSVPSLFRVANLLHELELCQGKNEMLKIKVAEGKSLFKSKASAHYMHTAAALHSGF